MFEISPARNYKSQSRFRGGIQTSVNRSLSISLEAYLHFELGAKSFRERAVSGWEQNGQNMLSALQGEEWPGPNVSFCGRNKKGSYLFFLCRCWQSQAQRKAGKGGGRPPLVDWSLFCFVLLSTSCTKDNKARLTNTFSIVGTLWTVILGTEWSALNCRVELAATEGCRLLQRLEGLSPSGVCHILFATEGIRWELTCNASRSSWRELTHIFTPHTQVYAM